MNIEDFQGVQPEFIPQTFFDGELDVYGLVKDWKGDVIRSFQGQMKGSWNDEGTGTLSETFVFDDGENQNRTWTLKPVDSKTFIATANDVIGEGSFITRGNTMFGQYTLQIAYGNSPLNIDVQDWLHLQNDNVVLNHARMKKFGITVGSLITTIIKK